MDISSLRNELNANRNKVLGMNKEDFISAMQNMEKPVYEAKVKLQEAIDEVRNSFK